MNNPFDNELRLNLGVNFFLTENIAIEGAFHYNLQSYNHLFFTTGISIFTTSIKQKNAIPPIQDLFLKKGTWLLNPKTVFSFQNLFDKDLPTYFQPEFSIFLSDQLFFQNHLSFLNYKERSDLRRIFFRYEAGFQWFIPFFQKIIFLTYISNSICQCENRSRFQNNQIRSFFKRIGNRV